MPGRSSSPGHAHAYSTFSRRERTPSAPSPRPSTHLTISKPIELRDPSTEAGVDARHRQFRHRHGSKLHVFSREEAPWPFAFDTEVLEQSAIDHALLMKVRDNQLFTEFRGRQPKRCLDLGTALGDWVIDTAQRFPDCTFVGFDLVDVQIPLKIIEPSVAKRIQWVHGNFLEGRLPFPDDEFDFIHVAGVALGVPENKWGDLFEECNRVLRPGGHIEMIQQDARFPVLPRWFTGPLHEHLAQQSAHVPYSERPPFIQSQHILNKLPHAYTLLEELFYSVFESRFINPTPSSILPGHFTTTFRQVVSPPVLRFPMPPIAPLIPKNTSDRLPIIASETTSDPLDPWTYFIPMSGDCSISFDTASTSTAIDVASVRSDLTLLTTNVYELELTPSSTMSDIPGLGYTTSPIKTEPSSPVDQDKLPPLERTDSLTSQINRSLSSRSRTRTNSNASSLRRSVAVLTPTDATRIGDESSSELFRMDRLLAMGDDSLFMHLYQASRMVFALKEAMWEELRIRVHANDAKLQAFGWDEGDYTSSASRAKFDSLMSRYRSDMQVRLSLWHSLVKSGWAFPRREPLSNGELMQEEKLRRDILEARKNATEEEFTTPVRSIRLLIGVKG